MRPFLAIFIMTLPMWTFWILFPSFAAADVAATEDPYFRIVPIARQIAPDATNRTPHVALVRQQANPEIPEDVWVPWELLSQMNIPIKLNAEKTSFTLRVGKPSEALGAPALAKLAPNAIDLEFRAKSDDNRQYFNLTGMESAIGLSYVFAPGDILVVGKTAFMSAYAQTPKTTQVAFPAPPPPTSPFNLVWDHVMADNSDLSAEGALPGINVLSPTWFVLLDETGRASNRGGASYVASAHANGYSVWGLVSNGFNKERTKKFLANAKAQDLFIANMLAYAALYGLDGINIDFENVDNDDASRLTEFVRRFTAAGKTMGLLFSMDITIPTNWSRCFDRPALSKIVDYIAVMTYDEHWRTSPKAGSTASLPWVENALAKTLADVPAEKLLMGIPLYTREWEESKDKNGKTSVKSLALSMASVDERMETSGADKKWLDTVGQYYFQYISGDRTYRIWVEDENSMSLRLSLAKKHSLAGAAFWRKGFEKPEIWDAVKASME
jgi:spore germination protein YaaH